MVKNNHTYWANAFSDAKINLDINKLKHITKYVNKKDKILEAGCGPGKVVFPLLSEGYKIYGLDFSKDLIKECQDYSKKTKIGNPNSFVVGDILRLEYKEEFDVYMSFGVIEHFKQREQRRIIKQAKKSLKKGGKVVITVPNSYSPNVVSRWIMSKVKKHLLKDPMVYQKNISTKKIRKMFEREGFKTISCKNYGFDKAINRLLLLNYKKIFRIPNLFYYLRKPILKASQKMGKTFHKFGETTEYVGIKR
ncbi:class I SAM-dependent methyltransferase [Candidatus Woesearchaeota archaeon]|nr:class I SAM-dependent methyltransferase [Candidatus Woesearchaeota archaeon]